MVIRELQLNRFENTMAGVLKGVVHHFLGGYKQTPRTH